MMIVFHTWITQMAGNNETLALLLWKTLWKSAFLAQQVSETTLLDDVQKSWNNFVSTGQIWALLIGIVIGYTIRNITAS